MRSVLRRSTLLAVAFLVLAGAHANAADSNPLEVKVPFPFVVHGKTLPAGRYRVERADASRRCCSSTVKRATTLPRSSRRYRLTGTIRQAVFRRLSSRMTRISIGCPASGSPAPRAAVNGADVDDGTTQRTGEGMMRIEQRTVGDVVVLSVRGDMTLGEQGATTLADRVRGPSRRVTIVSCSIWDTSGTWTARVWGAWCRRMRPRGTAAASSSW